MDNYYCILFPRGDAMPDAKPFKSMVAAALERIGAERRISENAINIGLSTAQERGPHAIFRADVVLLPSAQAHYTPGQLMAHLLFQFGKRQGAKLPYIFVYDREGTNDTALSWATPQVDLTPVLLATPQAATPPVFS